MAWWIWLIIGFVIGLILGVCLCVAAANGDAQATRALNDIRNQYDKKEANPPAIPDNQ